MLTQEKLKKILHYNPETGIFTRIDKRYKKISTPSKSSGYQRISINYKLYFASRLAWLYVYGEWPSDCIDHINGIKHDNRISNLRNIPNNGNAQNKKSAYKNNTHGYMGVTIDNRIKEGLKKYRAFITINGKYTFIGSFYSPEEAHQAYINKKLEIHKYFHLPT